MGPDPAEDCGLSVVGTQEEMCDGELDGGRWGALTVDIDSTELVPNEPLAHAKLEAALEDRLQAGGLLLVVLDAVGDLWGLCGIGVVLGRLGAAVGGASLQHSSYCRCGCQYQGEIE